MSTAVRNSAMNAVTKSMLSRISSSFSKDFKSRNWSVYGQWLGFSCFPVCIALGVVNLLHMSLIIIFSIIALVQGLLVVFLEIPLFLKICPVTERFASFLRVFHQNRPRAGFYIIMAAIQYGGIAIKATSLIACAVLFTITSFSYFMAYITKQEFVESAALGGEGVERELLP